MAVLGWGKPRIFIAKVENDVATDWVELPTPVENSTELSTEKGDKQEAKIEGGANEDVRYAKNTYALALNLRAVKGRVRPIEDEDGIILGTYAICVQPEDPEVDGFMIDKSAVSIEDTWSTEEGGIWIYTFDALQPKTGKQLKWGKVVATGEGESLQVQFTESK